MKAKVYVMLKKGVFDPQGKAVASSLISLGFNGIKDVRLGKCLEIEFSDRPRKMAEKDLRTMCEKLLANPVIEDYRFEIIDEKG